MTATDLKPGDEVLIWSGEWGAYWRPEGAGYCTSPHQAWVLPLEVAQREVKNLGPEKAISLHLAATERHKWDAANATEAGELQRRNAAQAQNMRALWEENETLKAENAALKEDIDLLRARVPRRYILTRKLEWVRLFQEVHGFLRVCHTKHGTDFEGRNHAMNALIRAAEELGDQDAANEMKLADINYLTNQARARDAAKADSTTE